VKPSIRPERHSLLGRLPPELRDSFTPEQLEGLVKALGGDWRRHPVDLRGSVGVWRWRYYYVFIAGRERRELSRLEQEMAVVTKAVVLLGFLTFSVLSGLLVLYLVKSALGIDLIPGFSLGLWTWFKQNIL